MKKEATARERKLEGGARWSGPWGRGRGGWANREGKGGCDWAEGKEWEVVARAEEKKKELGSGPEWKEN